MEFLMSMLAPADQLGKGALVGGLTVREIADAYLQREATVAQRVSRAKQRLRERRARFELPPAAVPPPLAECAAS